MQQASKANNNKYARQGLYERGNMKNGFAYIHNLDEQLERKDIPLPQTNRLSVI